MSGECDKCSEHCLDCTCVVNPSNCSITELRDRCNNIDHMLMCLILILQNEEYRLYIGSPHLTLILDIQEKIRFIEEQLRCVK